MHDQISYKKDIISNIDQNLLQKRQELCDWFCIIASKLKLHDEIFITSIRLFDILLTKLDTKAQKKIKADLHFITCILISIKFHGYKLDNKTFCRINLEFISKHLCQEIYSPQDIKEAEMFVLKKINFIVPNLRMHKIFEDIIEENDLNQNFLICFKFFLIKFNVVFNFLFLDEDLMENEYSNICKLIKKIHSRNENLNGKFISGIISKLIKKSYSFLQGSNFKKYVVNNLLNYLKNEN